MKWMLALPEYSKIYGKRTAIECINSMMKGMFGVTTLSKLDATVRTELMCQIIAYDLGRVQALGGEDRFDHL